MRYILVVVIITAFLLVLLAMCFQTSTDSQSQVAQPVIRNDKTSNAPCMKESEIADRLQQLVTEKTRAEHQTIRATFREKASQSAECRKQVVMHLMAALNTSDRDR
jgi:non-homologous end joining protein Ku